MPRWFHRFYAWLFGYFWLPCPICKEYFGGHEWPLGSNWWIEPGRGYGVCKNCTAEANRRNAESGFPQWKNLPNISIK